MSKHKRLSNIESAEVIRVIEVRSIIGEGTEKDPMRQIREYFNLDGARIARTDNLKEIKEIHKWTNEQK